MFGVSLSVAPERVEETWKEILGFYNLSTMGVDLNDTASVQGFVNVNIFKYKNFLRGWGFFYLAAYVLVVE